MSPNSYNGTAPCFQVGHRYLIKHPYEYNAVSVVVQEIAGDEIFFREDISGRYFWSGVMEKIAELHIPETVKE